MGTKAAFKAHLKTVHNGDTEMLDSLTPPGDSISAGQLDFVALLSCVDDLQLPVPVQVVESEEVVRDQSEASILRSDQSELLSAVSAVCPSNCPGDSASCPGILFSDSPVSGQ